MINITRELPSSNFIGDVESMFNLHISSLQFDDNDIYAMHIIDKAELIDRGTGLIRTPYGLTSIKDLSTGCKTVLVYNYCFRNSIKKVINVNECGVNALIVLFDLVDKNNDNASFFLKHQNKTYQIPEHDFNVDGERGSILCLM